jgi:hypothetical protein
MINLYNTEIESLHIHKVGNKSRKEELFLSQDPYNVDDEIRPILKEFFFKAFREKEEQFFRFSEDAALSSILNIHHADFSDVHIEIARHLYNQGNHPHIKAGEVYVCQLKNIITDEGSFDGIGIFKSEIRYDFLEFSKNESRLDLILKQGVSLDKLDKGAIIIHSNTGFKVLYIDSNKYDSKYWLDNFLQLEEMEDSNFQTKKYLKFCEAFAKEVVLPSEDKQAELEFINDTYGHFASRDEFKESDFVNEVVALEHRPDFEHYKDEMSLKYSIEDLTDFEISNETVNDCMKKVKGEIVLDTGISIKVAKGSNAASKYLEKGWDEEKQMYYYLSYFNKEIK